MKKLLIHCKRCAVLLLALTAAFAVGCTGDLEDDIADLNDQLTEQGDELEQLNADIETLEKQLDANVTVDKVENGIIYFSDNSELDLSDYTFVIVDEQDEYYVLSVDGETYIAYKDGVVFPSDISLAGSTTITTVLEQDKEYGFNVQIYPSNFTIDPSNFYLVGYEENPEVTKGLIEGEESAESSPYGDVNEQLRVKATDVVAKGDGKYEIYCVWTAAEVEVEKVLIYVSVEYPKYYWDETTSSSVRGYEWLLSDSYLGQDTAGVLITDADVYAEYDDDDAMVQQILHMAEGTEYVYDLQAEIDAAGTGFISQNLTGAAFVSATDKDDDYKSASAVYYTLSTVLDNAPKYMVQSVSADGDLDVLLAVTKADLVRGNYTFGSYGAYSNTTGVNAQLTLTAPYITSVDSSSSYTGVILYDDTLPNTDTAGEIQSGDNKTKYYSDIYGGVTTTVPAAAKIVSTGYVTRPLTIYVHNTDSLDMYDAVKTAMLPNGVDGSTSVTFASGTSTKSGYESYVAGGLSEEWGTYLKSNPAQSGSITYEAVGSAVAYTKNEATYGYLLDVDYTAYATYVKNNGDSYVALSVTPNTTDHTVETTTYDLNAVITFANTADQPVLPGEYDVTSTFKMTYADEDGNVVYEGYKVYTQTVGLYAPQYTIQLASTVLANGSSNVTNGVENLYPSAFGTSSSDDNVKAYAAGKGLQYFYTYEWYDFDLARLVDVDTVSSSNGITAATNYTLVETDYTSTTYSDAALALYDYKDGEYVQSRFFADDATDTLASTSAAWEYTLDVEIDGQDASNLVTVEPLTTGSTDVYKKVTFFQTLTSGLKVPVQIVNSSNVAVTAPADKGSIVVGVKVNGIVTNALKSGKVDGSDYDYAGVYNTSTKAYTVGASKSSPIDFNSDINKVTSAFKISVDGSKIIRTVPTYLNLLKESFNFTGYNTQSSGDYKVLKGIVVIDETSASEFRNELIFDATAFKNNYVEATYTEQFKTYVVLVENSSLLPNVEAFDALTDDLQASLAAKYESAYLDDSSITASTIYVAASGSITAAQLVSQIGDGGSDRAATVNLLPESPITYSVGDLCDENNAKISSGVMAGATLISIDEDGYIYQATTNSSTTAVTYSVPVTVCVTDITGGTCYDVIYVYIKY